VENLDLTDPVALLKEIEARCRSCSSGMPQKQEPGSEWSGIAFRVGNNSLVTPLGEVVEILEFPRLTPVPLARPWVKGIANIRGSLLPVIDLTGYLKGSPTKLTSRTRVLVVDHDEVFTGLVVDEVFGMKHFMKSEYASMEFAFEACMEPYMRNGFHRDGHYWGLFSLHLLTESAEFLQAAV